MRWTISRLYGLLIFGAFGWLAYSAFKSGRPDVMVIALVLGSFLLRPSMYPVFEWGEGHRPWDSGCWSALLAGAVLMAGSAATAFWLSPRPD